MPDDPKLAPIEPVVVTVIGTGDGTGAPLTSGTKATTPDHQPNLVVQVINPLVAILVRFVYAYFTILVGLLAAAMTSDAIPAPDFTHLFLKCAGLSVAGACVGALKDVVTIFSQLEKKFPLASGSV